jgi:hypothetical protein
MIPPRRVWLNIGGTVYEVTVYDLLTPDDTPDALKFAQGPGYITVRQVIYPVVPPQTGDLASDGVALRPARTLTP